MSTDASSARVDRWRNGVVMVDDLPAVDDAPFEPLDQRYLTQQRTIWSVVIAALVIGFIVLGLIVDIPVWIIAVVTFGLLAIAAAAWVLEGLAFSHRGVQLRERDVSTRRGLISRTTTSVPFTRVQHVTVERGALDRVFGLADVVIYTAGALSADARVQGLDPDRADRLREDIINRSSRATPVGSEPERPADGLTVDSADPPDDDVTTTSD